MPLTGAMVAARLLAINPDLEKVTLKSLVSGQTYTNSTWTAQEVATTQEDYLMLGAMPGQRFKVFELITEGQRREPKEMDQINDGANIWTVKSVEFLLARNVFRCRSLFSS